MIFIGINTAIEMASNTCPSGFMRVVPFGRKIYAPEALKTRHHTKERIFQNLRGYSYFTQLRDKMISTNRDTSI